MPARYETLAGWANQFGWKSGVELGVFDGTTLFYLLDHCPDLSMVGVDLWGTTIRHPTAPVAAEKCKCEYCNATRDKRRSVPAEGVEASVMKRALLEPRATIIKGNTAESAGLVVGEVDFVFVDAGHDTNSVILDIQAWSRKIKPGGRLIGHDINMKTVRDAVYSLFLPGEIKTEDDHVWWTHIGL
jgi:hypothetical protein